MKTNSPDRTGILIMRLWMESNLRGGLRARITQTLDSAGGERTIATTTEPEDIYATVRTCVEAFVSPNGGRL